MMCAEKEGTIRSAIKRHSQPSEGKSGLESKIAMLESSTADLSIYGKT